jgi:hypothetical protein
MSSRCAAFGAPSETLAIKFAIGAVIACMADCVADCAGNEEGNEDGCGEEESVDS